MNEECTTTATTPPILRSRTPRLREPICPPWCDGHDEFFQTWEQRRDYEDRKVRQHATGKPLTPLASGDDLGLTLHVDEPKAGDLSAPVIAVYAGIGGGDAEMSLTEARSLHRALGALIEQAEEWQA